MYLIRNAIVSRQIMDKPLFREEPHSESRDVFYGKSQNNHCLSDKPAAPFSRLGEIEFFVQSPLSKPQHATGPQAFSMIQRLT